MFESFTYELSMKIKMLHQTEMIQFDSICNREEV